ncbi:phage tail tube protein [Priestia megaterium]|jgi:hypothetical protein|uniref:phage tail tube protein n=1 Tax=Priestia megaterium TaxID=1404 RepID=UPI0039F6F777
MALDATRTLSGTMVKIYHNGKWVTNAKGVELQGEINYEDIPRAGNRALGKKATTIEWTGTLTNYKINHDFIKAISQVRHENKTAYVTELMVEINDPESPDTKAWIRVKGVQFTTIPVLNFEVGEIVEEELPFVFTDYQYV